MLLSEGLAGWRSLSTLSAEAQLRLWGSILSTVCLYIAQWFAMKALGPLMASTLVEVRGWCLLSSNQFAFRVGRGIKLWHALMVTL